MSDFRKAMGHVLQFEGGFVNHPADPGGATNKGVIQRVYDTYRRGKRLPLQSVRHITSAEVDEIYENKYWKVISADNLTWPLNLVVFDAAVNCGPARAKRWLAAATGSDQERIETVNKLRREHYKTIIKRNPRLKAFEGGWENRMRSLEAIIKE